MPTKIYLIKMIFGLMLATVLLITHVKKTKKSKVPKMR